jgi:hypothetical protein
MKKIIFTLLLFGVSIFSYAQVGIGTNTPDNSAMLEIQTTTKGILFPRMTSAQRVAIPFPANGLYVFDTDTKSLWYYNNTVWVNTASEATFGDVKSGIQTTDHSGWVLLNGRALATLSATQQTVAASLGLAGNLPDASSSYLSQNGTALGSVSGSNTNTLTQANLPNVSFTGTAAAAGGHTHTVDPASFSSSNAGDHSHSTFAQSINTSSYTHNHGVGDGSNPYNDVAQNIPGLVRRTITGESLTATGLDPIFSGEEPDLRFPPKAIPNDTHSHTVNIPSLSTNSTGSHSHDIDVPNTTSSSAPDHTHSVTVSSGGSGTAINIAPKTLSVNMFIYLGL